MQGRAIGLVRTDVPSGGVDLEALAARYGYGLVHTVFWDIGPVVAPLVLLQVVGHSAAEAIVVPGFEHIDAIRRTATDLAVVVNADAAVSARISMADYYWKYGERVRGGNAL